MFEKDLIINNRQIKYSGIFVMDDLFRVINDSIDSKSYKRREKRLEETVVEHGKNFYLELRPYKEKTNYMTLMIKIRIEASNLIDVVKEFSGKKKKVQDGDLLIIFDSWLLTDNESRWEMKPTYYFLKGVFNKWIYKSPKEPGFKSELVNDTAYVYAKIKDLLATYRKHDPTYISEKDVRKGVEEDIEKGIIINEG